MAKLSQACSARLEIEPYPQLMFALHSQYSIQPPRATSYFLCNGNRQDANNLFSQIFLLPRR